MRHDVAELTSAQQSALHRVARGLGDGSDGIRVVNLRAPWGRGGTTVAQHVAVLLDRPLVGATGAIPLSCFESKGRVPIVLVDSVGTLPVDRWELVLCAASDAARSGSSLGVLLVDDGWPRTPSAAQVMAAATQTLREQATEVSVHLERSTDDEITRLLRLRHPRVTDSSIRVAVDSADGSPGLATLVLRGTGTTRASDVRHLITQVDPQQQLLIEALARVPVPIPVDVCQRLSDVEPEVVDQLLQTMFVNQVGEELRLVPAFRGPALRMATHRSRPLTSELVELLKQHVLASDDPELMERVALAVRSADAPAVALELLQVAARQRLARGEHLLAFHDLWAASQDRTLTAERRTVILVAASVSARQSSLGRKATDVLRTLDRYGQSAGDKELAAFVLHELHYHEPVAGDFVRLQAAAELSPQQVGWSARAAAALALEHFDPSSAAAHDATAVRLAERRGDHALLVLALRMRGLALVLDGRPVDAIEVLERAISQASKHGYARWQIAATDTLSLALESLGRGAGALAPIASALEAARQASLPGMVAELFARRAMLELGIGCVDDALRSIEQAERALPIDALPNDRLMVSSASAHAFIEQGVIPNASRALERFRIMHRDAGNAHSAWELQLLEARFLGLHGEWEGALLRVPRGYLDDPSSVCSAALFLARTANQDPDGRCAQASIERASDLLDALAETPVTMTARLEVLAIRSGDGHALRDVADRWQRMDRRLDAARARISSHALSDEDHDAALLQTHRELRRLGAMHDADRLAASLRAAGLRSQTRRDSPVNVVYAPLNERDLHVAMLVADGFSNQQIADRMHLQRATVKRRLALINRKLGTRSRSELAHWVARASNGRER